MSEQRRAQVIGTGLIGGSIGMALRARRWHVTGHDQSNFNAQHARERGAIDEIGLDDRASICFLAMPVSGISSDGRRVLEETDWVVTDVGSVKGPIVAALDSPRFVGGHPMAGSEQDGIQGSSASMFEGAVWVLTPTATTDPKAQAMVHSVVASFGADVITLDAAVHDQFVAMVSHVPHLTAATLMGLAGQRSTQEGRGALLRLAAGGFRDMTRIASGSPYIWPDICGDNREAIVDVLDDLIRELTEVRSIVDGNDRNALIDRLESAREGRLNLPTTATRPDELVELRVGVPDRPGVLAAVTAMATQHEVNIYDIEIAHSAEGPRGVLILLVDSGKVDTFVESLFADGYAVSQRALT
ncbi:MAG TPA: prephenate dehydrogenase/arogenate dehydrogenase family protein [Microthrixaceae bacterium]|nr:prephenate dehydrogenase/arogenate dehydrogenase family protein [Microthrixaceae bacterium]